MSSYATYGQYVAYSGDTSTPQARVEMYLEQQSAKLRGLCDLTGDETLTADQSTLAMGLVCDAVKKALVATAPSWLDSVDGLNSASMNANGFQLSVDYANASGTAWFDTAMLKAFKRTLGRSQKAGWLFA